MKHSLLLLALAGCGPEAGVYLTVQAPLVVPTASDGLHVAVTRVATGNSIFDHTYALSSPFPQTLTLVTSNKGDVDPQGVSVEADALLAGAAAAPWATASGQVQLADRALVPLTLTICNAPPDAGCTP